MMLDYIVVGLGLAGIAFCEQLEKAGKRFMVVNDASRAASVVAGGLYNPVVLKRFSLAWKADQQLKEATTFYGRLQHKLDIRLDYKIPVYRRFTSAEEQNLWFEAADTPNLQAFLSTQLHSNKNPHIDAPFGFGEVLGTGRIATKALVEAYIEYLGRRGQLISETFRYDRLALEDELLNYGSLKTRHLVFATGFRLVENPYFGHLPLQGTKGELLTIHVPQLKEDKVIKSAVFIIPLGRDFYRVGATYARKDKTDSPTNEAGRELQRKLERFIKCSYQLVDHVAGIRPTVPDRRPLVGTHPEYRFIHVLNGLGSRGVLVAPFAARQLYEHIENEGEIDPEMDISRYHKNLKRV